MGEAASSSSVKLKLLIDTKAQKVLFAEASKDFVDFLIYLLSLPVGTVIRLLKESSLVGSFGKLYKSIENLHETYIQQNQNKDSLLNPRAPICDTEIPLLLVSDFELNTTRKLYTCDNHRTYVADLPNLDCPNCTRKMGLEMSYVAPATANNGGSGPSGGCGGGMVERGFVKGVVTYMVMDDLEVKPMSTISSITLLNKFNVKDVEALDEKDVEFGLDEVLKLLKASMECKTVLTSVFLGNKKEAENSQP
ncbi:hypothetical protein ACOSP7_032662 [Xanthoceras sorbifolium]|uniref:DUF674 domain-containing protein n=1 Tax=Xanthoceras sorbifolium TaxID=99658 RepID=A0ABQ8GZM7_9ROSI|nr:hypothetical protein JRO89_XSUnG0078600 [Xanthoceras sorbifolium]